MAEATGYRPMTVARLAHLIRAEPERVRFFLAEFLTEFDGEKSQESRAELLREEPSRVTQRIDAFLAGLAEYLSMRDGLDVPAWVSGDGRYLDAFWFFAGCNLKYRGHDMIDTPAGFFVHGILIPRETLGRA